MILSNERRKRGGDWKPNVIIISFVYKKVWMSYQRQD